MKERPTQENVCYIIVKCSTYTLTAKQGIERERGEQTDTNKPNSVDSFLFKKIIILHTTNTISHIYCEYALIYERETKRQTERMRA